MINSRMIAQKDFSLANAIKINISCVILNFLTVRALPNCFNSKLGLTILKVFNNVAKRTNWYFNFDNNFKHVVYLDFVGLSNVGKFIRIQLWINNLSTT